ncbi:MAG TPA: hypothetical protein VF173_36740 [Thermoanaerobaculia bacterium]|nr:hypothetical protein [Thermoanaerobaculia bacterium]
MALREPQSPETAAPNRFLVYATGAGLFLFIPLVLFLFVRHPAPVGVSLGAGILLMVGHRFLARPYMSRVAPVKCVWCNRVLPAAPEGKRAGEISTLDLRSRGNAIPARCCAVHRRPATQFFNFLHAWRWPLRLGIFVPLLFLLIALAASAAGQPAPVDLATAWFKLVVGLIVNLAALGYFFVSGEEQRLDVPFPAHNFFLLGVRILLWIFRLVGLWWIWQGLAFVLRQ